MVMPKGGKNNACSTWRCVLTSDAVDIGPGVLYRFRNQIASRNCMGDGGRIVLTKST